MARRTVCYSVRTPPLRRRESCSRRTLERRLVLQTSNVTLICKEESSERAVLCTVNENIEAVVTPDTSAEVSIVTPRLVTRLMAQDAKIQ